jgi:hypothetical protein
MKSYEILYTSALSPDTPVSAVSAIISRARRHNREHGITGLLVFDGERFVHLLEGARDAVFALLEKIRNDGRHTDMKMLHFAAQEQARFNRFTTGFVPAEQADVLDTLTVMEGVPAVARLVELIPVFELDR